MDVKATEGVSPSILPSVFQKDISASTHPVSSSLSSPSSPSLSHLLSSSSQTTKGGSFFAKISTVPSAKGEIEEIERKNKSHISDIQVYKETKIETKEAGEEEDKDFIESDSLLRHSTLFLSSSFSSSSLSSQSYEEEEAKEEREDCASSSPSSCRPRLSLSFPSSYTSPSYHTSITSRQLTKVTCAAQKAAAAIELAKETRAAISSRAPLVSVVSLASQAVYKTTKMIEDTAKEPSLRQEDSHEKLPEEEDKNAAEEKEKEEKNEKITPEGEKKKSVTSEGDGEKKSRGEKDKGEMDGKNELASEEQGGGGEEEADKDKEKRAKEEGEKKKEEKDSFDGKSCEERMTGEEASREERETRASQERKREGMARRSGGLAHLLLFEPFWLIEEEEKKKKKESQEEREEEEEGEKKEGSEEEEETKKEEETCDGCAEKEDVKEGKIFSQVVNETACPDQKSSLEFSTHGMSSSSSSSTSNSRFSSTALPSLSSSSFETSVSSSSFSPRRFSGKQLLVDGMRNLVSLFQPKKDSSLSLSSSDRERDEERERENGLQDQKREAKEEKVERTASQPFLLSTGEGGEQRQGGDDGVNIHRREEENKNKKKREEEEQRRNKESHMQNIGKEEEGGNGEEKKLHTYESEEEEEEEENDKNEEVVVSRKKAYDFVVALWEIHKRMEEHEAAGGHPTAPAGRGRGSYHSLYGESRDSSKYKEEVEDERERKRSEETSKEENVPGGRSSSSSQARSPRHLHDRSSSPPVKRTLTAVKAVSPAPFPSDCTEGDRLLDEAAALILREEEEKKEKECESRREEKIETDETHGAKEEDEEENEGEYERNIKKALEEKRRREGVVSREELERCACPQKPLKNVLPGEEFNLSLAEVFRVLFHDLNHAQNPFHRILTDQKASITPPYPSWVPHDLLHLLFSSSLSSSRVASSKRQDEEEEEDVEKEKERLKNLLLTLSYSRPRRQLAYEMDLPVTTLNRLLGLPSRAQVEEKFSVFFLSRSCLLIQKDASLHGLPLSDCFFTRVRYRLTALNDEASLALDFSLLRDEEEEKRKKKKRKEEEGQKEKDEEKEEEESSNQEKEGAFQIQEECKKEDDKNISSTGKISSSSPSPRMQMDFEYEVIFTKSTFLQGKITSQGEAQVSADLSQFCMYSREALKEVYETTSSSSSPSSSMEKKGDMRIANKAAHSQVTEEEEEERKSLSLSDTRHDEDESRAKERSQGEKEGSSGPLLASASPSSSTCLLATPPSVHERGERREEAFSRVSFSPTSFLQNRLGRFNGRSVLSLRRIRRRCGTFLSSLRGLLLFLFSPSSFVGLLLHLLPSTPFEALLFIMVCALMWNVMSLQRDLHALLEGKIQREEGEGRDEEGRGRCLLGPGSNTSLLNAYLDFYTSRK